MKHIFSRITLAMILSAAMLTGCSGSGSETTAAETEAVTEAAAETAQACELEDGVYDAGFETDSTMFKVNEACDGKGTLTVENGQMTIHVSLVSEKIVNLYVGTAEDAQKDGAELLQPTTDTVTYSDGYTEEVYGFDIPVPAIDEEFDLAILGTKGTWYDHKVKVTDPQPKEEDSTSAAGAAAGAAAAETEESGSGSSAAIAAGEMPEDGTYSMEVTLEGGSGRASVDSPATVTIADGKATATIVWSSPYYDYMIVDGETLKPVNTEGNSTFEIPVAALDTPIEVTADTTAMSTPHEIDYTLTFSTEGAEKTE